MGYEMIILEVEERIAKITLNRPKALNAMTLHMFEELEAALKQASKEAPILIIAASGRAFCTGADLDLVNLLTELPSRVAMELLRYLQSVIGMVEELDVVAIAAINGYALGGGLDLALACDFRIAAHSAKMGEQYIKVGIIPDVGGTQRLPRMVGLAKAKEMILLGEMVSGQEAERIGLVNRAVPDDQLESETRAFATALARGPIVALRHAKRAIHGGLEKGTKAGLELEVLSQAICMQTDDAKEGIAAFREKRSPQFQGK